MYPTLMFAPQMQPRPRRMRGLRAFRPPNRIPSPVVSPARAAALPSSVESNAAVTRRGLLVAGGPGRAPAPTTSAPSATQPQTAAATSAAAGANTPPSKSVIGPVARSQSQSGYCVYTSSPETGGVSSIEPCDTGEPGGTPISGSLPTGYCVIPGAAGAAPTIGLCTGAAGQVPVGTTPAAAPATTASYYVPPAGTPPGYPPNLVGTIAIPAGTVINGVSYSGTGLEDTNGNIWTYVNGVWTNIGQGGYESSYPAPGVSSTAATPAITTPVTSAASPVPSTQPTNQPYVDSSGNIWTYNTSTGTWQVTGNVSSSLYSSEYAEEEEAAGAVPATAGAAAPSSGGGSSDYQSIIDWLNSDSLINGVANFWILGAGVVGIYLLKNKRA